MSGPAEAALQAELRQDRPIPLDVSLAVAPGELFALVGPSGSGKTTTLRALAGLDRVHEGRIAVDGRLWQGPDVFVPPQRRRVGMVFQHYALFPHLSALDNVALAVPEGARAERRRRARELLRLVHLEGLEDRRPHQLSGGQQQRVALARALARDPVLLLLDEPFSAVDQVTRRRLQRELVLLRQRRPLTTVLVTHDLDEAVRLSDRMAVIHHGRTLQSGPPRDLLDRPASALVARLLDIPNVYRGRVRGHDPARGLTLLEWDGLVLEARHRPEFAAGAPVDWVIPPGFVVLHRVDRPSRGERENPVEGRIVEFYELGETAHLTLLVRDRHPLTFTVPAHVARRNALAPGRTVRVSLLAEGVHLMPPEHGRSTAP
ncbi:Sulfate/thiosulfate import ATP-binding protein CysA [bacterium HR39]|nr:Sulfate/thiosulfate import ATP-binding protein CysA [bacterium HR39]